jgi:ubiquitin-conjugating enzyme E2 J1
MRARAQIAEAGANPDFEASPLEDNLFEWHFTIRGPPGTAFEGGRYHGRITLPPEYPFKPPSITLLNASGRFTVGKKICLSVSAHHPEHWQPAWGIRTIITALIGACAPHSLRCPHCATAPRCPAPQECQQSAIFNRMQNHFWGRFIV